MNPSTSTAYRSSATASSGVCMGMAATGASRSAKGAKVSALQRLSARHAPRRRVVFPCVQEHETQARVHDAEIETELVESFVQQSREQRGREVDRVPRRCAPPRPASGACRAPARRRPSRATSGPARGRPAAGAPTPDGRARVPPVRGTGRAPGSTRRCGRRCRSRDGTATVVSRQTSGSWRCVM